MGKLRITSEYPETFTVVSNHFIDTFIADAKGDYVKIYLYLLRVMQSGRQVSVGDIADYFDITEKDLCRALRYWIKQDVLRLNYEGKTLTGITLLPLHGKAEPKEQEQEDPFANIAEFQSELDAKRQTKKETLDSRKRRLPLPDTSEEPELHTIPDKPSRTPVALGRMKAEDEDFSQLLYLIETYFGKPLSSNDMNVVAYIYDNLEFDAALLEYLIEFCTTIHKKSVRYMERTAVDWYERGVRDVETAKKLFDGYPTLYKRVLKALSIRRQTVTDIEKGFIDTWYQNFGFDETIILEACNRAILQRPSNVTFPYVNGILENWHKYHVRTLSDIEAVDKAFYEQQEAKKKRTIPFYTETDNKSSDGVINQLNRLMREESKIGTQ